MKIHGDSTADVSRLRLKGINVSPKGINDNGLKTAASNIYGFLGSKKSDCYTKCTAFFFLPQNYDRETHRKEEKIGNRLTVKNRDFLKLICFGCCVVTPVSTPLNNGCYSPSKTTHC